MNNFAVTIFIETSIHGPAIRTGSGMYMIEYIKKNGDPETRQGITERKDATENALALEALAAALKRITKSCSIRVNTQCDHILNTMGNHWLPQWRKNDWRNAKGKPIKNMELWQQLSDLMDKHCITFGRDPNSYATVMQAEMKKEAADGRT